MDDVYKIIGQNLFSVLLAIIPAILGTGFYIHKINNLQKEVDRIRKILDDNSPFGGTVRKNNPLSLTEKGQKILKESGAQDYIDQNKNSLIQEIKTRTPKSLYDVQELAREVIELHKGKDEFTPIKDYTYKNGLALDHIIMAMAVYLRDYALIDLGFQNTNSSN